MDGSSRYVPSDGNEFGFHSCFQEVRPSQLIIPTFTFEGEPDGVALRAPGRAARRLTSQSRRYQPEQG